MDKVLITGATGFIGGRLVETLREAGYRMRALVRDPARAGALTAAGVELAAGDVTDRESIERALDGVEGIFHLAAIYDFGVAEETMRRVNVEGTRNLLDAAAARGIQRILYCGSDTSLGDTGGVVCDESKRPSGASRSAYESTKREAHELVCARIAEGAPLINAIVSTVYGPGDPSTIGELIAHHLAGRLPVVLDRSAGYTFAHVDDVAEGLRLAYERGRPGESYLISGTPASFGELFAELSKLTGVAAPALEVPRSLLPALTPLLVLAGRALGKSGDEVRELIAMGHGVTRFFSNQKARDQLKWRPRSLARGLADTLPHYAAEERAQAASALRRARKLNLGLAAFDVALGGFALFAPRGYLRVMHPRSDGGPTHLVSRTGAVWLFFAAVEALAAARPESPEWTFLVGMLRLMDVPADLVYLLRADDLGAVGRAGLLGSVLFNAAGGAWLVATARRAMRAARRYPFEEGEPADLPKAGVMWSARPSGMTSRMGK
jgi:dihydroflavonol-4-reductase